MMALVLALGSVASSSSPWHPSDTVWTDARSLGIQGRGWPESELPGPYDRMPRSAQATLDAETWSLSRTATGLSTAFTTDATDVYVRYNFTWGAESGDWLWPINGHSGVDIYVKNGDTPASTAGEFRWAASSGNGCKKMSAAAAAGDASYGACLEGMAPPRSPTSRTFLVYLPARATLGSVEVGVRPAASAPAAAAPWGAAAADAKPVAWYGTSIVHGAAALHAGMVWTNQANRMLRRPGLNLGFSGDALMQPEVGAYLAKLDPAVYVLDCEFNMDRFNTSVNRDRTLAFVRQLRAVRPATPIIIAEGHPAGARWHDGGIYAQQNATRAGYRAAFNALLAEGVPALHYLPGDGKFGADFGTDFEAQVGAIAGTHPSDYAFMHMAKWGSDFVARVLNGTAPKPVPMPVPPVRAPSAAAAAAAGCSAAGCDDLRQLASSAQRPGSGTGSGGGGGGGGGSGGGGGDDLVWTDAKELGVEGKGWPASENPGGFWRRLPDRAANLSSPHVWELSKCSTGMLVRFSTDAPGAVSVRLARDVSTAAFGFSAQDDIMSFNGRFGIDVYMRDAGNGGAWRWAATSAITSTKAQETTTVYFDDPRLAQAGSGGGGGGGDGGGGGGSGHGRDVGGDTIMSDFTIYLPTHVSLSALSVGVPPGAALVPLRPYSAASLAAPLVVWGSSIAQGGVVQNAGMIWPSCLQRLLDVPLLNFGFSGSCLMQPDVAALLGELKPRLFVMDCLPNMQAPAVNASAVPVLRQLRSAFGDGVPIVLLEGHTYTNAWIKPSVKAAQDAKRAAQRGAMARAAAQGVKNLHYVGGDGKLASLGEAQYDATGGAGVHPSNIAHLRMAEFVADQLKPLLPDIE